MGSIKRTPCATRLWQARAENKKTRKKVNSRTRGRETKQETSLDYSIPCRMKRGIGTARGISTGRRKKHALHEVVEYRLQLSTPLWGHSLQGIHCSNRKLAQMCNGLALALALAYVRQPFAASPPSYSYTYVFLFLSLPLPLPLRLVTLSTSSWLT